MIFHMIYGSTGAAICILLHTSNNYPQVLPHFEQAGINMSVNNNQECMTRIVTSVHWSYTWTGVESSKCNMERTCKGQSFYLILSGSLKL